MSEDVKENNYETYDLEEISDDSNETKNDKMAVDVQNIVANNQGKHFGDNIEMDKVAGDSIKRDKDSSDSINIAVGRDACDNIDTDKDTGHDTDMDLDKETYHTDATFVLFASHEEADETDELVRCKEVEWHLGADDDSIEDNDDKSEEIEIDIGDDNFNDESNNIKMSLKLIKSPEFHSDDVNVRDEAYDINSDSKLKVGKDDSDAFVGIKDTEAVSVSSDIDVDRDKLSDSVNNFPYNTEDNADIRQKPNIDSRIGIEITLHVDDSSPEDEEVKTIMESCEELDQNTISTKPKRMRKLRDKRKYEEIQHRKRSRSVDNGHLYAAQNFDFSKYGISIGSGIPHGKYFTIIVSVSQL